MSNRLQKTINRKSARKRLIRYGLVTANVLVLAAVVAFVITSSHSDHTNAASVLADDSVAKPVDGITAYDIAANVAHMTNLDESAAIDNQAQSAKVAIATSTNETNVVTKPQLVATALKSRDDIKLYVSVAGDTVTNVAQKFGVTSDSIKWSNGITSDTLSPGTKLSIPPVNGIVYTVKAGDTVQSLATKYKANVDQIIAYNDAEISGLKVGEKVLIPNGQIQQQQQRVASIFALSTVYAGNGYVPGYCTYYAYNKRAEMGRPIGSNWGNANTWAAYASAAGYRVDHTPEVGAVQQNGGGLGHVAVVVAVHDDGSYTVSEMNFVRYNTISQRTLSASAAANYNFIH